MMTFFVYLLIFLILATAVYGAVSAAPFLPTKKKDVSRMVDLADIKAGEKVYDLGCGDGRLVFEAIGRGASGVGIEIFVLPYLYAAIKSLFIKKSKIIFGDLFNHNLSDADVMFIFLQNKSYKRLIEKFAKELKPGTRLVVGCWEISEWKDKLITESKPTNNDLPLYLYKI